MRTRTLAVPVELIKEIAEQLAEQALSNEITGINEDEEILIEITYSKEDAEKIFVLMEYIDDYKEENNEQ